MTEYLLMGAGGAGAGFIASLLGIGGGLFVVPWLTLVFNLPMHQAIATSLIAIIATSSGASSNYLKTQIADVRLGLSLGLATVIGAITGGFLAGYLNPRFLSLLFAGILLYAAFSLFKKQNAKPPEKENWKEYQIVKFPLGWGASFLAGNISGLLGVGGGIITVPVMHLVMRIPFKVASATSTFMIGMTGCASAFLYYFRGEVDFPVTGAIVLGMFVGSYLGSHLLFKIKTSVLQPAFVVLILFMALKMFSKGMGWRLF